MRLNKDLLKLIAPVIFTALVFQLSGCSSSPANSESATLENESAKVVSATPTPEQTPKSIADENFEKEWKSKFDASTAELERNRRLWQESKINNYDFVIVKYAGGVTNDWQASPILIKVREGEKFSTEAAKKGYDFRIDSYTDFDTIDKFFNYLRQQLEKGKIIYVEYDKKFGYPIKIIHIKDSYEIHGYRNIAVEKLEIVK